MTVAVIGLATTALADTTDTAPTPDSLTIPDTLQGPPSPSETIDEDRSRFDSLMATLRGDTAEADTAEPVRVRDFRAIETLFDSTRQTIRHIREPFQPSLPSPRDLATVDMAGWLVLQPTVDVNNAAGPGGTRYSSRWGLIDRRQWWVDDAGESFDWLRLGFPQAARADVNVVPVFLYDSVALREKLYLGRETEWPYHARSSYFLGQGYYGETYSQGIFRRLFAPGFGIDLGFGFYENDGTSFNQNYDNRHLRLRVVGPVGDNLFWNFRFNQFRDQSLRPPPAPFSGVVPIRDDLLNVLEGTIYRPTDSTGTVTPWIAGLTRQQGKHDIRESGSGYRFVTHTDRFDLWTQHLLRGWLIDARAVLETLEIEDDEPSRWGVSVSGANSFAFGESTDASVEWTFSDWDTDPPAPEGALALRLPHTFAGLRPGVRVQRSRIIPTLFDRLGTYRDYPITGGLTLNYAEAGNPDLNAEWRNDVSVSLVHEADTANAFEFGVTAKAGYVENYTTWEETLSSTNDVTISTPVSRDARHVGAAVTMSTSLPWQFATWFNYAFKYAEDLNHDELTAYNPHAASWVLSWIAPKLRYNIDIRLNSTLLWWYGDSRYPVTLYTSSPHVVRWDLSASARMQSFTFHYSLQNVTNFPYRTESGGDLAVQRMRFGIAWQFID
ncbi:MAG: hypothetical protein GF341_01850 [candidate division Zixibacteria bacterium]|nr:hypothetical protein [candidate division Zixibacteria bacterium]